MKMIYSIFADILLFIIFICILVIPSLTLLNLTPTVSSKKMKGEIAGIVDSQAQPTKLNSEVFDKIKLYDDISFSDNVIPLNKTSSNDFTKNYSFKLIQLNALDSEVMKIGSYHSTSNKNSIINIKLSPPELSNSLLLQIQTDKYLKEFSTEKSETSIEISPQESSDIFLKITAMEDIRDVDINVNIY